jgi:hypothetical protein
MLVLDADHRCVQTDSYRGAGAIERGEIDLAREHAIEIFARGQGVGEHRTD